MIRDSVFVGLSGGVDSAVSTALLKEQGYDVVGAFIKIWQPEFIECNWKEERLDALRVCAALDIPFHEIDFSQEYKKEVVDTMVSDYEHGITPNPDVLCNRAIKFGSFAAWAKGQGAHSIATGHYARKKDASGHFELLRAADAAKDQSYFLYRLRQQDLARAMFPIGHLQKKEVRALAKRFKLPVAEKPDSQGLCFIGKVSMRDFLSRFIKVENGPVVDTSGKVVGEHEGAAFYTLGQRHGFISSGGPYYITDINVQKNTVHVSTQREDAQVLRASLTDTSWIHREPVLAHTYDAQARYHEKPIRATLSRSDDDLEVSFQESHIAPPGQSLVLYEGEVCLGGGTLVKKVR